jgi:hypothetical protein
LSRTNVSAEDTCEIKYRDYHDSGGHCEKLRDFRASTTISQWELVTSD